METKHNAGFPKMELQIPFYGIQVGWFTALFGEIHLLEAIAFGIYRLQAEFSGGRFDGKSGVP
jgi:hypothetical protein